MALTVASSDVMLDEPSLVLSASNEDLLKRQEALLAELREVKFWLLVDRQPNGCWPWLGFKDSWGYGQFERSTKAHQQAYRYAKGSIPSGMVICHSCDNPQCVRPAHLFAGTPKENSQDMARKGRAFLQKVDRSLYEVIRAKYAEGGVTQKELGDEFGISQTQISRIVGHRP